MPHAALDRRPDAAVGDGKVAGPTCLLVSSSPRGATMIGE